MDISKIVNCISRLFKRNITKPPSRLQNSIQINASIGDNNTINLVDSTGERIVEYSGEFKVVSMMETKQGKKLIFLEPEIQILGNTDKKFTLKLKEFTINDMSDIFRQIDALEKGGVYDVSDKPIGSLSIKRERENSEK